jgi:hypothetical protein
MTKVPFVFFSYVLTGLFFRSSSSRRIRRRRFSRCVDAWPSRRPHMAPAIELLTPSGRVSGWQRALAAVPPVAARPGSRAPGVMTLATAPQRAAPPGELRSDGMDTSRGQPPAAPRRLRLRRPCPGPARPALRPRRPGPRLRRPRPGLAPPAERPGPACSAAAPPPCADEPRSGGHAL